MNNVGPRPLNSGDPFSLQVAVSCALSTREQMHSFVRVIYAFNPFFVFLCETFSSSSA